MTWWLADRGQPSAGKASRSGCQARLTRHFFGEGNAREEDSTEVKAQKEQDQSGFDRCLTNDIDGHANLINMVAVGATSGAVLLTLLAAKHF
jgi:hypothetical protein